MLSGSFSVIKYLLIIFNFIFVITGIAILSVGIVITNSYSQYEDLLNPNYFSTPALLIAIGVIIFIVAFFGCCGSIKENYCMLLTFATLMIMIIILELGAGIAGYVLRDNAETVLRENMLDSMKHYNAGKNPLWSKNEWDTLQKDLKCCGTDKPADWVDKGDFNTSIAVPYSCCSAANISDCGYTSANLTNIYQNGCLPALGDVIRDHAVTLGGAGIGIAVVQIIGVILPCALAKGIKQGYETV